MTAPGYSAADLNPHGDHANGLLGPDQSAHIEAGALPFPSVFLSTKEFWADKAEVPVVLAFAETVTGFPYMARIVRASEAVAEALQFVSNSLPCMDGDRVSLGRGLQDDVALRDGVWTAGFQAGSTLVLSEAWTHAAQLVRDHLPDPSAYGL